MCAPHRRRSAFSRKLREMVRRILSIDGGGILGIFPAAFLAALERDVDQPIGEYFDLICGTSTGGIIAIALALGMPAASVVELYANRGPHIFGDVGSRWRVAAGRVWRSVKQTVVAKHDSNQLRKELHTFLGDKRIGHARRRLVVPAWDPETRSVHIFKTAHHLRLSTDYKRSMLDAAMATAAAPTYFGLHRTADGVGLVDGGTWANNPVALGVVEAMTILNWPGDDLRVLSLGCGSEVYQIGRRPGRARLANNVVRLFLDGQSHGALGTAKLLTGHTHERPKLHRFSPIVSKGQFAIDDTRNIEKLTGMAVAYAREAKTYLNPTFFSTPAAPFEPVHQLEVTCA